MDSGRKKTPMDQAAKSRIMSANAKKPEAGGQIKSGSFPARAQSAADKNANRAQSQSDSGDASEGWCTVL